MNVKPDRTSSYLQKRSLLIGLCFILYLSYLFVNTVTTETKAYMHDAESEPYSIQAGKWWDGSKLSFLKGETEQILSCEQVNLKSPVYNSGFGMYGPTSYEVYYAAFGNPRTNGTTVSSGTVQPIQANSSTDLTYSASKPGSYIFKVNQRPGYDEDYSKTTETWGNRIIITCIPPVEEPAETEETVEEVPEQPIEEEVAPEEGETVPETPEETEAEQPEQSPKEEAPATEEQPEPVAEKKEEEKAETPPAEEPAPTEQPPAPAKEQPEPAVKEAVEEPKQAPAKEQDNETQAVKAENPPNANAGKPEPEKEEKTND